MEFTVQRTSFVILILICQHRVYAPKPPVLSAKEQTLVNELKALVTNRLTVEYMKSDGYLIKWLKAKQFDVNEAKEALDKTLVWRKETGADNLPYEDFSKLDKGYPIDFTVRDTSGRPVILLPFNDWNIRRKALEGKVVSDLGRRMDFIEENAAQLTYNLTGDSTSMLIADLNGFSLTKHSCIGCIPFYLNFVRHHELHYPYSLYKLYGINAPAVVLPIIRLVTPLMTESTRDAFHIFGYDREEFRKNVLETIAPENLPFRYGGTKTAKLGKDKMKLLAVN